MAQQPSGKARKTMPLSRFHPVIQRWFSETLGEPTPAQRQGWAAIRERKHALIAAPTGSGKTLAAFLTALDDLFVESLQAPLPDEVRVVYVSPLKALSADIHKNPAEPRKGIRRIAEEMGLDAPRITAAVRTGDTTQSERAAMLRTPPHILVTTPESLYLLLTAEKTRQMLRTARTVIVDEIHAVIGTRRGAHLAITLERLQQVAESPLLRLGLSATQKPIENVAKYLVGATPHPPFGHLLPASGEKGNLGAASFVAPRPACGERGAEGRVRGVVIVDEGHRRAMDLAVEVPRSGRKPVMAPEVWEEYFARITALIHEHRTTLVFVNTRRMAERVARHLSDRLGEDAVTAHHGSLSKEKRLDAETRLKNGQLKALVATASLELGIDIGYVDLVCQIGSPHRIATLLQRVGRSGHTVSGTPKVRGRRGSRMLAITSGGAIPEVADYRVILEGEDTFIGTLNEDFAIESNAGDIFQLGNASWLILQVTSGTVRVADAKGAPPTIPFWLGEAPARSDELSRAVSELRVNHSTLVDDGIPEVAATEITNYFAESQRILGELPTQDTLIAERFFDESGGMQLVIHSTFGSRINRAWGLALRKRFCRQFNFELQAAATEDAILLSLGPQHSFPLADVFRYLHPATARDVLVQAMFDAPVFQTRWRWNTTISLAIPRNRHGRKIPPQLQRAMADDLMAAVFPDAAACFENIAGDRQIPDHPLVNQTVRDCLEEAMDFDGLASVLTRIHDGTSRCIARATPEPSPLAHAILTAAPYAFLDDAPLEERRTQAVYTRRASGSDDVGKLDLAAIERVRDEESPDPRDADELHDALLTASFLTDDEASQLPRELFDTLIASRRATPLVIPSVARDLGGRGALHEPRGPDSSVTLGMTLWITAERLPELLAVHPSLTAPINAPASRNRAWTREEALVELIRGRMTLTGPTTARALAASLAIEERDADQALLALESEGAVLRGSFESRELEWCDRRLLARIHRYTLNRLRAEIEPVTATDFMRFLFQWQHATPSSRLAGIDGLQEVIAQLDGFEVAASAWERNVLPLRVANYEPSMLDMLCLGGEVRWARLSSAPTSLVSATPIALWTATPPWTAAATPALSEDAQRILEILRTRGASFARDLGSHEALGELVSAGLITSDGFAGLRALISSNGVLRAGGAHHSIAGRWSLVEATEQIDVEAQARVLLRRYGIVFRRLAVREANAAPWRELARVYRRMEARGEIRGGRFVTGMSGEQFALPEGVEQLRETRRMGADGVAITVSAAEPLE